MSDSVIILLDACVASLFSPGPDVIGIYLDSGPVRRGGRKVWSGLGHLQKKTKINSGLFQTSALRRRRRPSCEQKRLSASQAIKTFHQE